MRLKVVKNKMEVMFMKIKMICFAVTALLLATALTPAARAEDIDVQLLARAIENAARGESYTVMVRLARC